MKKWLINRFLPMWAKETVFRENRKLKHQNRQLSRQIRELESYIRGMHRVCPRVIIKTGGEQ